jgi:hypothetical protein
MRDMATRNEHEGVARCFLVIFGCAAIWWGIVEFPVFWQESSIERMADRIIAGALFKADVLARQDSIMNSIERSAHCRPVALRSFAIVELRRVETEGSAVDRNQFDKQLNSLSNVIRGSLSCAPADPFLWLVLSWIAKMQNESNASYLGYLRMSYQLGPNEGWIALRRNPIVLANLEALPPDFAEAGISEFVALVRSHLYSEAADILAGLAWPVRRLLFSRLRDLGEADRRGFAKLLNERGLDDTSDPGIELPLQRLQH